MQLMSPPNLYDNPALDSWLKSLWSGLTSIPASAEVPSSATDVGVAGTIAYDASFIYICVATDTWKRVAVAAW